MKRSGRLGRLQAKGRRHSPDIVLLCRDGRIVHVNAPGLRGLGLRSALGVLGKPLTMIFQAADQAVAARLARGEVASSLPLRLRLAQADGAGPAVMVTSERTGGRHPAFVLVQLSHVGAAAGLSAATRSRIARRPAEGLSRRELEERVAERTRELRHEIAERQRAEDQLRLAAHVIESTGQAVLIADADFKVTAVNPAFSRITGYEREEVIGRPPSFLDVVQADRALHDDMRQALKAHGRWETELWNRRKDGGEYAELVVISAVRDAEGVVHRYATMISDITRRKQAEKRMQAQANYDVLTGLPNRALFIDLLHRTLADSRRRGERLGLMFIDLDGFKLVNDTLGHDVGDLLLCEAAARLVKCVRRGDTVARLGGDEFTVLMPHLGEARFAPLIAQRILGALSQSFHLAGQEAFVSGSIGITIFPDDADDAIQLLRNADTAMYQAKERGKATYQFFTAELNRAAQERLLLRNRLQRAAENDELTLHYQPKMDIRTGFLTGVEALMRWYNPELGQVSPERFIPVLEETGMVVDIGAWALRQACRQQRAWEEAGLGRVPVAVNLSARQLREPGFPRLVERILADMSASPADLEIEITESMLMSDAPTVVAALQRLHDMGIRIAMDDFGTGYSSLSYLKRFPIDTIKIDRSFVADVPRDAADVEIIRAIITMGHSLNRRVLAEGVETEEQFRILRTYHCDELQGYMLSPPLPPDRMSGFLRARLPRQRG